MTGTSLSKLYIKLLILGIIVYTIIFSLLSIIRHQHFFSQGWDMALYEQIIWQYSQGKLAFSSLTQQLDFADRFRPLMLVLVPFYRLFPYTETLLIFQAAAVSLTALPLYLLSFSKTKKRLFSLIIALSFLSFISIQTLLLDDFHELALITLPLSLVFYFLHKKKWLAFALSLLACLMVREYIGFLMMSIGIYILLTKINFKVGILSIIAGTTWSIGVMFFLMPYLGQTNYYGFLGGDSSLFQEFIYLITHPIFTAGKLFIPVVKLKTILTSFASFSFLPLFHPSLLIPIFFQFASRFLDTIHPYRWTLFFHYSAELAVLMSVGTIWGALSIANRFKKHKSIWGYLTASLIVSIVVSQIFLPVPIKLIFKPDFFKTKPYMINNRLLLSQIPPSASVATQNNLAPHLAKRQHLYLLPNINSADYIMVDLHSHQDSFNFYTLTLDQTKDLVNSLIADNKYKIINQKSDTILMKKVP